MRTVLAAGEEGVLGGLLSKLPGMPEFIVDPGANDGLTGPVSRNLISKRWSRALLEPVSPAYFLACDRVAELPVQNRKIKIVN